MRQPQVKVDGELFDVSSIVFYGGRIFYLVYEKKEGEIETLFYGHEKWNTHDNVYREVEIIEHKNS